MAAGGSPLSGLVGSVDPGLLDRFRAAGAAIQWRAATGARPKGKKGKAGNRTRIAHLNDEEARVVELSRESIVVDSGPLGALVLLLEIDRRGAPAALEAKDAGVVEGFTQGAIAARWGAGTKPVAPVLPMADLVTLARYALA